MSWRLELRRTQRASLIIGGGTALEVLGERASGARDAGRRLFVVTDAGVMAAWGETVLGVLAPAVAPEGTLVLHPGEETKSVATTVACWQWLAGRGARRDDAVVAFGGGVIGDLAGFVAATYLRGLELWQVPTTLLAQVDSSVGGKVAVNLPAGKNLVGSFYQPDLVVIDPRFLATLSQEQYGDGLGEVLKYALLDRGGLFAVLESSVEAIAAREFAVLDSVIERCVRLKVMVVEEDETDLGGRAVLNLGHTTAHALEAASGYRVFGHGEAVALGLLVALHVSEEVLGTSPEIRLRLRALMEGLGLRTSAELPPGELLLEAAERDKKITAAGSGFVCLRDIGRPVWGIDVPREVFLRGLRTVAV